MDYINLDQHSSIQTNSNKPFCYLFTVGVNKCCCSRNTIDDPYVLLCVPNNLKIINIKVLNLTLIRLTYLTKFFTEQAST